jgi:citrate lyase subunit beta/citryl-CoA lyase
MNDRLPSAVIAMSAGDRHDAPQGVSMSQYRPRRSMLYIPACVPRFLAKGRELKVDSLILDLEESVLVARKTEARRNAVAALKEGGYGHREVVVRVNRHDSAWGLDDLTAVAPLKPDAILFPRIESRREVLDAIQALDQAGGKHIPIMVMIETPMAVLRAEEIAGASDRLVCLVMGTSDLTNELHARITPERLPILYSLSHCLLAARAHGLPIVDGVHLDMKDMTSFEFACRMARDLGYDGKTVIHPLQVQYANDAFTPRPPSVERGAQDHRRLRRGQRRGPRRHRGGWPPGGEPACGGGASHLDDSRHDREDGSRCGGVTPIDGFTPSPHAGRAGVGRNRVRRITDRGASLPLPASPARGGGARCGN